MGCDIHAFIDVWHTHNKEKTYVETFAQVHMGRDYELFNLMAGVRGDGPGVVVPRGFPDHMGFRTECEATLFIFDGETTESGFCTPERAKSYLASGSSEKRGENRITHPDWHTPSWMFVDELEKVQRAYSETLESDWDAIQKAKAARFVRQANGEISVKELNEFSKLIEAIPKVPRGPHRNLAAVIAAMKALARENAMPRLVFWFDN